jgi:hypothetical protein
MQDSPPEGKRPLDAAEFAVTHMKLAFPIAVSVAFLGIAAPTHAREERGQGGHPQEARPAQQQARPAQQRQQPQQQARPAQQQQQQPQRRAGPAAGQPRPTGMPAQQQHMQQAARLDQQQVAGRPQSNFGRNQVRAQQSPPAGRMRGSHEHGRISDDRYASHFGSRHSFHVNRGDYEHRRFWYGGYQFGFLDPWPVGWGYSDDVYVEYDDGGYYMYNRFQPGVRISISIL